MSKARKAGLILASILIFSSFASAASEVTLEEGDKDIWMNTNSHDKVLNADLICENEDISSASITDSYGNPVKEFNVDESSSEKEVKYDFGEKFSDEDLSYGKYTVKFRCGDSTEDYRKSFDVDKLKAEVSAPEEGEVLYLGTSDTVNVKLSSTSGELGSEELSQVSRVDVFHGDDPDSLGRSSTKNGGNVTVPVEIREDLLDSNTRKAEDAELRSVVRMQDPDTTNIWSEEEKQIVKLNRWKVNTDYSPSNRLAASDFSELNLTVELMRNGEPVTDLEPRHFYMEMEDNDNSGDTGDYEWFSGGFEGVSGDSGVYSLALEKMPPFEDTQDYSLSIFFETSKDDPEAAHYDSLKVGTAYVEKKFTFEGRVSDSDSRAIETAFRLQSDEYIEEFETNSRGFFSRRVMPDSYGMDVEFPKGSLSLSSVELGQDYSGNINYQYYKSPGDVEGVDLRGIDPINMMTVSFGYPFDSGTASMQYNPAKTEDPMNVDLYECQRWNFWGEECISGWDRVDEEDVTLPPTSWNAEFPVTPVETEEYGDEKQVLYSAYVIGTNSGLALDRIGLESYRVAEGESFEVRGRAVTKGQPVENADVSIELLDGSTTVETASTTTDSEGTFSTNIDAPEAGNYSVRAEISKGSYEAFSDTIDQQVEVYRQKSLEVELPESFEVAPGETVDKTVTLTNDGQMAFEDASIEVVETDLDISFSDEQFTLEPGDEIDISASATVPEGFCDPSCVKYPTADIGINDGDFNEEYDLGVEIVDASSSSQTSSQQEDEQTNDGGSSSPLPDTPAGMVPANPANFALGLITVFSLALAAAVRKKKDSSSDRDSRTVNLQRPKVEPSEESDEEIDDVAGNMSDGDVDAIAQAMEEGSGQKQTEDDEEEDIDELAEAMAEKEQEEKEETELQEHMDESSDDSGEQQDLSCDICGEEFDTESGLKLHKKAFH